MFLPQTPIAFVFEVDIFMSYFLAKMYRCKFLNKHNNFYLVFLFVPLNTKIKNPD
jgi:hypothetical protein